MAIDFLENFEGYNGVGDLTKWWTAVNSVNSIGSTGRGNRTALTFGSLAQAYVARTLASFSTKVIGYAIKVPAGGDILLLYFYDDTSVQCGCYLNGDGTISIRRGTTVLATSASPIALGVFHYIEFKATINNSTGSAYVYVDGAEVVSITGADTQNTGNSTATQVRFYGQNSIIHDVYCDTDTVKGDLKVVSLFPNGAGNYSAWTPSAGSNYQNVDETQENGDTDYNASSTSGNKDSYAMANMTGTAASIIAVQAKVLTKKTDAGAKTLRPFLRVSSTDYNGASYNPTTDYVYESYVWEANPNTSSPWAQAEVDGIELGIEDV